MSRAVFRFIWPCVVLLCCVSTAWGTVRYVPEDYPTITAAVAVAVSGDVVSITPGTYRESITLSVDGVVLESRGQAATTNTTIITGDMGNGDHYPWVIWCAAGTGPATEIRYLTLTGVLCDFTPAGAIVVDGGSSVTIRDNLLTENYAGRLTSPTAGGVLCLTGSAPTIRHNQFASNWSYDGGGGVCCQDADVLIEDNTFTGNGAHNFGGAIRCDWDSSAIIRRNIIQGNSCLEYGAGGIYSEGVCEISRNYIAENVTGSLAPTWSVGGGILLMSGSALVSDNLIVHNSAQSWGSGGGISLYDSLGANATIVNNTLVGNTARLGSAIYVDSQAQTVTVHNNIVTSNLVGAAFTFLKSVDADYNCFWNNFMDYEAGAPLGPHELAADPLFVSATPSAPEDFDLQLTSPCIDSGTDSGAPADDYAGRPRPQDGDDNGSTITDIGAYEVSVTPVAGFSGTPTLGYAPLEVCFTDVSSGTPTSWSWDFGDGGSSTAQDPCHSYGTPGRYTVELTICNSTACDTLTLHDYISVSAPPVANFSGSPTRGRARLAVSFTDLSTDAPTAWSWEFGDGATSAARHPTHDYITAGRYAVSLIATNPGGSDTETKPDYITVSFTDVPIAPEDPEDHWALNQILACVEAGIVGGYPDGSYRPTLPVARDAMAVFIARALAGGDSGVPTGPATATFTDVATDHWAFRYVEHAVDRGVTGGYPDGTYRPTLTVDRGQMAVFMARAMCGGDASVPTGPPTAYFTDVPTDHWAFRYVEYIRGEGVTGGYPDGTYRPLVACTRDQMAVYIQRAFALPL